MNETPAQLHQRYELILNCAGEGIYGLDHEANATFVNPAAVTITGWASEDIIGKPMHQMLRHTQADGTPYPVEKCPIYAALKDGAVRCTDDDVFWRKDGSCFPVCYTSTPIRENGRIVGAVVVFQDITEQKRAETAIVRLQKRNELILGAAGEGIYGLDCQGYTTFVNPAATKMLGWTAEQLIGQPMHSLLHHTRPDGTPYPRETCPIYGAFKDGTVHQVDDEVFWRKDGSCFPVEYTSTPIREAGRLVGAVVIFRDVSERHQAEETIRRAQVKLAVAHNEMKIARQIQESLLPSAPLMCAGVEIAGYCLPADRVGGDYFDYFCRSDDIIDIVIADVSGHSVGSGLFMIETRTTLRAQSNGTQGPGDTLAAMNEALYEDLNRADHFITMFYMQYDAAARRLSYANAGQCPPLLLHNRGSACDELDAEGLVLGVMKGVDFEEKTRSLTEGDIVLLYTDGITEAEDPNGEFFGSDRLSTIVKDHGHLTPQALIERIVDRLQRFSQANVFHDDVTMVILRVRDNI